MSLRYVFGPVLSGRLGRSLGLDLLGAPICSMDCLYCEVGPTRALTTRRAAYVPAATILDELTRWRDAAGGPPYSIDVLTLGGMGEPTLNTDMPAIIQGARGILPGVPVAVLTNSTTLLDPQVRKELALADMVLPSLDSLVEAEFQRLCRPAPGISAAAVAQALLDFRAEFPGQLYLEILLSAGINDTAANLALLEPFVARLRPDRVDVVTLSRPGAYAEARAVSPETRARFRDVLGKAQADAPATPPVRQGLPTRSEKAGAAESLTDIEIQDNVLHTVRRRPQTASQLAAALGLPAERVAAAVRELERQGLLRAAGVATADTTGAQPEPFYGPAHKAETP